MQMLINSVESLNSPVYSAPPCMISKSLYVESLNGGSPYACEPYFSVLTL